ncbi:MAG: hypothetical protein IPM18_13750 [Phycisphaerales bacterium]|nr:hypothetical protein [Phycisphaerales bacterium]
MSAGRRSASAVQRGSVATVGVFLSGSVAVVTFALGWPGLFAELTRAHPFLAGFVKLFFLGTFGELLKQRLTAGTWHLGRPLPRALVWGLFGLWFAVAFPAFSFAVEGLVAAGLWAQHVPGVSSALWLAFSKSFWLNGLGMYGWGMMVTHNYCDFVIANGGRTWSLGAYARQADTQLLLLFLPKTLLFWTAAQTFNYSLPPEWRVFVAALLAIVLGFLLGVTRRSAAPDAG